jgi:ech hydrogenase subunit B
MIAPLLSIGLVAIATLGAPLGIGVLLGIDRRATAAIQLRAGPPLLQPLYDVTKLLAKTSPATDRVSAGLVVAQLVLAAGALAIVVAGGDLLVAVLVIGVAQIAFVLAAAAVESPYAQLGASREIVLMVAIEPLLILAVLAYGQTVGSFAVPAIAAASPPVLAVPSLGLTLGVVLAAALRKSPFDLASSEGAHQELVKGSTTEMAGRWLALAELGHWYEAAVVLAVVWLCAARLPILAAGIVAATYAAVVMVDNAVPRVTWRTALIAAWGIGGGGALVALATALVAAGGLR